MAKFIMEPSRTFAEFLLLPNLTTRDCIVSNVKLSTPIVKFKKGATSALTLEIPLVSAAMQSVSGKDMAVALAKQGGLSFIYCSQTIESQAKMITDIKKQNVKVGAAVNTHDYKLRVPALVEAGADILCIDSSDGFSQWQADVIAFVRENYGEKVFIGAGNIVSADAFEFLVNAGADFVKVGVGGGSICITREQKGIGRGQASALIEITEARDKYFAKKGIYVPLCSDGGVEYDNHAIVALAMGADFLMMGRNFARYKESPSKTVTKEGKLYKEYWGEGSSRAQNWQRYKEVAESSKSASNEVTKEKDSDAKKLVFEEGVDSYIECIGKLEDHLPITLQKIKSTMCNCGSKTLQEFRQKARLALVSEASIAEGRAHDVVVKN